MSFDLVEEPWIPVVTAEGEHIEVGIRDVLLDAHRIWRIQGEAPVVTAALHRLLLAVLHRAFNPLNDSLWKDLWSRDSLGGDGRVKRYLSGLPGRFHLFHSERPFLQCPGLKEKEKKSANQLLMHRAQGNNATLFDHTLAGDRPRVPAAVAARWLVTVQSFDTEGTKTPYERDRSSKRGLCDYFATVLVEGRNLKETLLLNLGAYDPEREAPPPQTRDDCPVWELSKPPGPEPDTVGCFPKGWTDLLTWPSRRILLDGGDRDGAAYVDRAVITPGTRMRGDLSDAERMAAFGSRTDGGGRKRPQGPPRAVKLEELRGVWRHSCELLLPVGEQERASRRRPFVVDHVAAMIDEGHLPETHLFGLRVFGQQLASNPGAVETWLEESMPMPAVLLRAHGAEEWSLNTLLGLAVGLADDIGEALKDLEQGYVQALRGEFKEASGRLAKWYWPRLSAPFGVLLKDLGELVATGDPDSDTSMRELCALFEGWKATVEGLARQAVHQWAEKAPRRSPRLVMELAGPQNVFYATLIKLTRAYVRNVRNCCGVADD